MILVMYEFIFHFMYFFILKYSCTCERQSILKDNSRCHLQIPDNFVVYTDNRYFKKLIPEFIF